MVRYAAVFNGLLFLTLAFLGLRCSSHSAGDFFDPCRLERSLSFEAINNADQFTSTLFTAYKGNVVYSGYRVFLFDPERMSYEGLPLSKVLALGDSGSDQYGYYIVMTSDKSVTGSVKKNDSSSVDTSVSFVSVLVAVKYIGVENRYALFALTQINGGWSMKTGAIRFYQDSLVFQDVDRFLLDNETPDYQLIPRSSIEGATDAELYDSHMVFHSIHVCQKVCEELFGGVPLSLAEYL